MYDERLIMIAGSMFSGKTTELIKKIQEMKNKELQVIVIKPIHDSGARHDIVTHSGLKTKALAIEEAHEIYDLIEEYDVIAIDEVQFFNWDIKEIIDECLQRGKTVIASGLDLDFKGEPFGIVPELLAHADEVIKKHAICVICGNESNRSQRLVNGKPAKKNDPKIVFSEEITYEPRCRKHHELRD